MEARAQLTREDHRRRIMDYLREHPGTPAADLVGILADRMSVRQFWGAFDSLIEEERVEREGNGWRAVHGARAN
jgi:hypothetical protein